MQIDVYYVTCVGASGTERLYFAKPEEAMTGLSDWLKWRAKENRPVLLVRIEIV